MEYDAKKRKQRRKAVRKVAEMAENRTIERALCELCGDVITTANGGRHYGLLFVSFERLLDLHMEQRHANVCVLPAADPLRQAA